MALPRKPATVPGDYRSSKSVGAKYIWLIDCRNWFLGCSPGAERSRIFGFCSDAARRIRQEKVVKFDENGAAIDENEGKRCPGRAEEGQGSPRWARAWFFIDFMLIYVDLGSILGSILAHFACLFRCDFRHLFSSSRGAILVSFGAHFHDFWEAERARERRKFIFAKQRFVLYRPAKVEVRGARRSM